MKDHQPVLLHEVIENLAIHPDGFYIDATFGRGGHSRAILDRLGEKGRLLAIDKDPAALIAAKENGFLRDKRFCIQQGAFGQLEKLTQALGWNGKVNGILMDIGVSSPQLDDPTRGFSFLRDGRLDMRMDTTQTLDAERWINTVKQEEISQVLKEYGEERYARRIAAAIVTYRNEQPITSTVELAQIIAEAHPRWDHKKHPATRSFQAIRIFINHELEELKTVLNASLNILTQGGRLVVITFHSLEDRIVKQFLNAHSRCDHVPRGLPLTEVQIQEHLRLKRIQPVITPDKAEINKNPRARSAKLRVMEKL